MSYNNETGAEYNVTQLRLNPTYIWWDFWNKSILAKDAGFVYESLQIEMNRVIWDFCLHKTNPQNESFKNESTKRIHDTNL
jgi:hypothetical protein